MTLLAELYAVEHREGYAKFPIEVENKLKLIDEGLEFLDTTDVHINIATSDGSSTEIGYAGVLYGSTFGMTPYSGSYTLAARGTSFVIEVGLNIQPEYIEIQYNDGEATRLTSESSAQYLYGMSYYYVSEIIQISRTPTSTDVITVTVHRATPQITLDLSTIGLSEGTHSIQIKLSDDELTKTDSELSTAVSYTVQPQGETWVLNSIVDANKTKNFIHDFVSNGVEYTEIEIRSFANTIDYAFPENTVYSNDIWSNEAYRTLYFTIPPTGDLLIWLESNGMKQ